VKVPFSGTDHYVDVNVTAGSLSQVKDGEYPDFYIALPAYNVGEKRMYSKKIKDLLMREYPKKKIGVTFTSVRVNGRKGLASAVAVFGLSSRPGTVKLGKIDFKTFGKLEDLTEELRSSRPPKVLSYTFAIDKDRDLAASLNEVREHIILCGGENNLIGYFLDDSKREGGRHTFVVSSPLQSNGKLSFKLNTRGSSGSAKKDSASSSQRVGSQI